MIRCHKCGFSNQLSARVCVKCRTVLEKEEIALRTDLASPNKKTIAIMSNNEKPWDPPKQEEVPKSFVDVGVQTVRRIVPAAVQENKSCCLVALSIDEEKELRKIELKEEANTLDRAKLDPSNSSISRNGHANIYKKDGNWYLENTTALKTTFVQVNKPTKLSEGDIILIGDSLFKFKQD